MHLINGLGALALVLCIGLSARASAATFDPISPSGELLKDEAGNVRYFVLLNEGIARGHPVDHEPPHIAARDARARSETRAWHQASVRRLVRLLESKYGIAAVNMTSWAVPAFSAHIPRETLEAMRDDPRIERVVPIYKNDVGYSAFADYCSATEMVPWGKVAVGADDASTSGNVVYMIDGPYSAGSSELTSVTRLDTVNSAYNIGAGHAFHVAGILAAATGGGIVRGINPGAVVYAVKKGFNYDDHMVAFDWVLADSEQRGIFAVVNFSSNGSGFAPSGVANKFFRRMSNRLLVVQSAGNARVNACSVAYGPANDQDGILVVGGVDEIGKWAAPYDNTPSGYQSDLGTNWGPCVEVWAPSQRIKSTWNTGSAPMELSGTSMAAPHVAALAARYGGNTTTPVEREQYVRSKLYQTGYSDFGHSISVPSFSQLPTFAIPSRIWPTNAYAGSSVTGFGPGHATDGLYLTNFWNSGLYPGPTTWIEFDLGSSRTVTAMRMTSEQNPESGSMVHNIYVGNSPNPTTLAATVQKVTTILEPVVTSLGAVGRYVRVHTTQSPSWVAWREIEIYGN